MSDPNLKKIAEPYPCRGWLMRSPTSEFVDAAKSCSLIAVRFIRNAVSGRFVIGQYRDAGISVFIPISGRCLHVHGRGLGCVELSRFWVPKRALKSLRLINTSRHIGTNRRSLSALAIWRQLRIERHRPRSFSLSQARPDLNLVRGAGVNTVLSISLNWE